MTKTLRSEYLVLFFSILLVAGYNQSLWQGLLETHSDLSLHNVLFLTSCAVFLTAFFNIIFSLLAVKNLLKPVLITIVICSALTSYFMDSYGVMIDANMLQNTVETDTSEALELFNFSFALHLLIWGLLPAWVLYKIDIQHATFFRQATINVFSILMSILAIGLIAAFFYQDYASTFRNHREFRSLINPTNYIHAIDKTIRSQFKQAEIAIVPITQNVKLGAIASKKKHRTITIFVAGEAARAQEFHLNGYARQTTPLLETRENLINFKHVSSCGTATAISLPCMFSMFSRDNYDNDKGHGYESLLDVLAASGTNVLWRDNNSGCKGVCDRVDHEDVAHINIPDFCNDKECFDEVLLNNLEQTVSKSDHDLFIVLHQKGSHGPAYYQRVPKAFEQFTPICQTSELQDCTRQEITNAYDNTVLYTDYVLDKVISFLKAQSDQINTAMIYVSDHGESLGEKNMYLHGAPYFMAPDEQTHVPMIMWLSDAFVSDYHIDRSCVVKKEDNAFSHDNLFHSVLGMLDIVSPENYQSDLDMFDSCKNSSVNKA
tara:strand:- start:152039 stop:153676 length:1638 start_codon:yes stop_codon:yes gene_type:complete